MLYSARGAGTGIVRLICTYCGHIRVHGGEPHTTVGSHTYSIGSSSYNNGPISSYSSSLESSYRAQYNKHTYVILHQLFDHLATLITVPRRRSVSSKSLGAMRCNTETDKLNTPPQRARAVSVQKQYIIRPLH